MRPSRLSAVASISPRHPITAGARVVCKKTRPVSSGCSLSVVCAWRVWCASFVYRFAIWTQQINTSNAAHTSTRAQTPTHNASTQNDIVAVWSFTQFAIDSDIDGNLGAPAQRVPCVVTCRPFAPHTHTHTLKTHANTRRITAHMFRLSRE